MSTATTSVEPLNALRWDEVPARVFPQFQGSDGSWVLLSDLGLPSSLYECICNYMLARCPDVTDFLAVNPDCTTLVALQMDRRGKVSWDVCKPES
jgi:hypothetical protein